MERKTIILKLLEKVTRESDKQIHNEITSTSKAESNDLQIEYLHPVKAEELNFIEWFSYN